MSPVLVGVLLLAAAGAVFAQAPNLVTNGDFESLPAEMEGLTGQGLFPPPWLNTDSVVPGADTWSEDGSFGLAPAEYGRFPGVTDPDGRRWAGGGGGGAPDFMWETFGQQLAAPLLAGATYDFSAQVHQGAGVAGIFCLDVVDVPLVDGAPPAPEARVAACCFDATTGSGDWEARSCTFVSAIAATGMIVRSVSVAAGETPYPGIDDIVLSLATCGNGLLEPANGEQCDDGNEVGGDCCAADCSFETAGDVCAGDADLCTPAACDGAGACVDGATRDCGPDFAPFDCWEPACEPATGQCGLAARPGFSLCISDPNNPDECTVEICTAQGECIVRERGVCDDGDACNGAEVCEQYYVLGEVLPLVFCEPGAPPDDGAACTGDVIACTSDVCEAGVCTHPADNDAACDDANDCTLDTCDPAKPDGCSHQAVGDGAACADDGLACTGDVCSAGICAHPADNAAACDDGLACTIDKCDATVPGGCRHVAADTMCTDAVGCTAEACVPGDPGADARGCVVTPQDAVCDDGDVCTSDACDAAAGCVYANPCDDASLCTIDVCIPVGAGFACENKAEPRQACLAADGFFDVRDLAGGLRDKLLWKWGPRNAPAVPVAALGDPDGDPTVADTLDYTLCVWDYRSGQNRPLLWTQLDVPPGLRNGRLQPAGWQIAGPLSPSVKYVDARGLSDGVTSVVATARVLPLRATASAKGSGALLPFVVPAFSASRLFEQAPAVQVQLVNGLGACWDTTFAAGDVRRHDATRFSAQN